ncbi:MAG TPA: hypothetical protein VNV17_21095 [Solirubrobacteraceae bacterium]|jgi:hypothetical protein|nr:hypothetical protein [Solirubrobacteraceae bacterium]
MLDPRIYRTGLVIAALALVVLAFSLKDQQTALNPTLAPSAFNGQNVAAKMANIAQLDPSRRPGSDGDQSLAVTIRNTLAQYGFGGGGSDGSAPTVDTFTGRTVDGTVPLENVVGMRPGTESGSIVIVAPRDALGAPATASASGSAMLMELARDLEGETLHRSIVLASTSGTQGTAGAIRLAANLAGPVDAVLVLGDLASTHVQQPIILPWSTRQDVAPTGLRNTVASALAAQSSLSNSFTGLGGQFAHLAFPFTLGQQAPFGAKGIPAVELSLSGEQGPAADAPTMDADQLTAVGRAVLTTISALDSGRTLPPPSAYVLLGGKVVPGWAISLFVLSLLVPVLMTTIDGVARARRRGHIIWRSLTVVLAAAVPFVLLVGIVLLARLVGILPVAPPGPVAAGAIPLSGGGVALLVVMALVLVGGSAGVLALVRRLPTRTRTSRRPLEGLGSDGAVAGLLVVMCVVTFAIWLTNPFAAFLLVPALHLWLWAISPDMRVPLPLRLALVALGIVPAVLVVGYYANELGYGPINVVWEMMLLLAGHGVSIAAAIEWSVVLGCLLSAITLSLLATRGLRTQPAPVTVRGPVTYAGPGSLGGTKSALRR